MKVRIVSIVIGCRLSHPKTDKGTRGLGNKRTRRDHKNDTIIIIISQNTEKNPGELKRFPVTQTPVRNHQLTPVRKNLKRVKIKTNNYNTRSYLPNPSARAGYDTRSIFKVEFSRFEFRLFLLLD